MESRLQLLETSVTLKLGVNLLTLLPCSICQTLLWNLWLIQL